ncbi:hypothetical protein [Emticicia agri]|uniref:YbbR-like domain-containing protein n=1 Tax=Emticicia agri TaxID=2492393 RepID=A0A4Q5LVE1_9BACT|nr:hypothetical protein [Emticicia agri]RYU93668.1 hypothetical protein EWM59_20750 [Emticicia agri]
MNFKTLILCFLAAAIFWLLNALNKSGYTTKINYPLEIIYDDSRYIPVTPLPKTIKVSLSSTGWNLLKDNFSFHVSPVLYEIANPEKEGQLNTTVLTEKLLAKLKNSKINYIVTDTFALNFERKYSKKVVLKIDSIGVDLEKNFVIASLINITPAEIIIEGPASALKAYQDTFYLKVPAKNLAINFDDKISIPLPKNPLVKISAEQATVSFEVAELLK